MQQYVQYYTFRCTQSLIGIESLKLFVNNAVYKFIYSSYLVIKCFVIYVCIFHVLN